MATANFYVKPQDGWVKVTGDGVNNIGFVRITSYPYTRPFYVYASPTVTPTAADVGIIANCGSFIVNTNGANTNVFWVRTVNPYLGSIKNDGSLRIDVEDSGIATTLSFNFTTSAYQLGNTTTSNITSLPGWSFTRASTKTALNSAGQVVSFASGVPAITDLGFLPEEARTNLLLQSADLTNASWAANAGLLSRTSGSLAPDNSTTAVKIVADTATAQHRLGQTITGTAAVYTTSVYAKASGYNWLVVNMYDGTNANLASFNLATGTIGTLGSGNTATITPIANGFYRVTVTRTMLASASAQMLFYPSTADNTISFTGDGVSGAILWGPQFELGSFATSYIPTTTAAVTRAADVAQVTGLTLPAAYTWFASGTLLGLTNSTSFPTIMSTSIDAGIYARRTDGGLGANIGTGYNAMVTTAAAGATVKWAFRAASDNANLAANGVIGTTATTYTPTTGTVTLNIGTTGSFYWNNYVKQIILFPSAFTDAALQTLST